MTLEALSRHYRGLEDSYSVVAAPKLAPLVVPNGNADRAFHRWFHLKEGYSCDLLAAVLGEAGLQNADELTILDPFVGGGTTLISAGEWAGACAGRRVRAAGIERNPFLSFLARAKAEGFMSDAEIPLGTAPPLRPGRAPAPPNLSTFANADFFDPKELQQLVKLRRALEAEADDLSRRLRLLALTTSVEPVSRLRRDGRTMRRAAEKPRVTARHEFLRRLNRIREDLAAPMLSDPGAVALEVHEGDGRNVADHLDKDFMADLVVCSPPYPNNIDYTEVYKLEAWFLGAYEDAAGFRRQRGLTLRSHPSVVFTDPPDLDDDALVAELEALVAPLLAAIPSDRYTKSRERLVRGYVQDMALTLRGCHKHTKGGGAMAVIVGNSLHGTGNQALLVAADLLIAHAGALVGWEVDHIAVGRRPVRRSAAEPRLRESMVLLRKPTA